MAKVQIVTDSTAYFSKEYAEQNNIRIVPLSVTFSGETVNEGFPGEFEAFYRKLQTSKDFPTTSQPSWRPLSVCEEILARGGDIITIVISEAGGTYNSASAAANMALTGYR